MRKEKKGGREWSIMSKLKFLILSFVIVFLVAFIGSLFTSGNTDSEWYQEIKPEITPPSYVFPIAWNIIFILIAISLYFSLIKQEKIILFLFGINFILNMLWSFLFFYLQLPFPAFIDLIFLEFSTLFLILFNWKDNKISSILLLPYFLWVIFAGILNYLIII